MDRSNSSTPSIGIEEEGGPPLAESHFDGRRHDTGTVPPMSPRTGFRVYLALSIVWGLLLVQGIGYAIAGYGISIPGAIFAVAVQLTLATLCIRARRRRQPAAQ